MRVYSESVVCPGLITQQNISILSLLRRYRSSFKRNDSFPNKPICWVENYNNKKYVVYVFELAPPQFDISESELPRGSFLLNVTGPNKQNAKNILEKITRTLEIISVEAPPQKFAVDFERDFVGIYAKTLEALTT